MRDVTPTAPPSGHVTIADAAAELGVKPWDVVRLIDAHRVEAVQFVNIASLRAFREAS